jgi:probable F420-dependent oxidoreductase
MDGQPRGSREGALMDVGVFVPIGNGNASSELLRALGPAVEERGFESVWVAEHVVLFDEYESQYPYAESGRFPGGPDSGLLEPLTALTYLAAVTDRVRLGTGICLVPQRNPVYTAKQVVDLDVLSGGRVDFGIGVGWLREEFEAVAASFERRGLRTDEYLQVMRSLWCDDVSSFKGETYELPPCRMYPKPVQQPHPPIHVGGESDAALRRVARFGQGWYSFNRLPDQLSVPLGRLDALLEAEGRARSDITLTVCPYFNPVTPAMVSAYAEAGVDRLVVLLLAFDRDTMLAMADQLVADVVEPARSR